MTQERDFGSCCACGHPDAVGRHVLTLPRRAPVPGTGWACLVCGLPAEGAFAVVCDGCQEAGRDVQWVVAGQLFDGGRMPLGDLSADLWLHDWERHRGSSDLWSPGY